MNKGFDGAMAAALRGDDAFFTAIENADPGTYGFSCECGTYSVGYLAEIDPQDACCPNCGNEKMAMESPALGTGPNVKRKDQS